MIIKKQQKHRSECKKKHFKMAERQAANGCVSHGKKGKKGE
jgi:hypothetical protein